TDRSGKPRRRPLTRVVLDERLQTSSDSQLVRTTNEAPLLIFAGESFDRTMAEALQSRGVEIVSDQLKGRDFLVILEELGRRTFQSVFVEGGASVAGKLVDAGLVNKVTFFLAPLIVGGRDAPSAIGGHGADKLIDAFALEDVEVVPRGRDIEVTGYPAKARDSE
ncbi:MAG TPA: RibD family protein, partial [Pyrinomonadaceae bacterium]|nr:RibD family protein [Pyrinomonadaceae bacterium]